LNKKKLKLTISKLLHLKILNVNDITSNYVNWLNDYEIVKFTEQRHFKHNLKKVRQFVREKYKSPKNFLFGIYYEGEHIGNIKLGEINTFHLTSEVSYFIGKKELWGKGIATRCVKRIIKFGFEKVGLKKVTAGYYEINKASKKVLEKSGFKYEGTRKNDRLFENKRCNYINVGRLKND
tara:strand:- start:29 stop:565 length:537 start_codon:yes stop_codon:yes gene_type:complete